MIGQFYALSGRQLEPFPVCSVNLVCSTYMFPRNACLVSVELWLNKRGKHFWVSDSSLEAVPKWLVKNPQGDLLLSQMDIVQELQETFFEVKKIWKLRRVYGRYSFMLIGLVQWCLRACFGNFSGTFFVLEELNELVKQSYNTNSFDPDGLHVKIFLLDIFNTCWEYAAWPWS